MTTIDFRKVQVGDLLVDSRHPDEFEIVIKIDHNAEMIKVLNECGDVCDYYMFSYRKDRWELYKARQ